jgi:hypothetical protein
MGVKPYASLLKQPKKTQLNRYNKPEPISIMVVVGRTNDFWKGGDWEHMGSFSIDDWR